MAKEHKYGIHDLRRDFKTDVQCLEFIFDALHSRDCSCGGEYRLIFRKNKKGESKPTRQYQCSKCRYQIAPTAGTIFHKSDTPLTSWFHALFIFSNAKSGISAKEMERQLNVTYKTAWRILNLIRKSLSQDDEKLKGTIEMDEATFGGKGKAGRDNKGLSEVMAKKSTIIGAVERKGRIKAEVSISRGARVLGAFIDKNISQEDTRLMTDDYSGYMNVAKGYNHQTVNHSKKEWARGDVHTNTIESFWSHIKRSIRGTHKVVSKKHLQSYLDGFVFLYDNRHNDNERFSSLLGMILLASR